MFLIVTRSFPPELGGMQSLMWGLSKELSKNFMIKVFADYIDNHKVFDEQSSFSICLLYTSPSPRDGNVSRMPSSA